MAWTRFVSPEDGIVQWVDFDSANAWAQDALAKSGPDAAMQLDRQPWERQAAAVVAAWQSYSKAFRALTLPWYDPEAQGLTAWGYETVVARLTAELRRVGETGHVESWVQRCYLENATSLLMVFCMGETPRAEEHCDFDGLYSGCMQDAASAQGCDPYTWRTIAWKGGLAGGAPGENPLYILPPAVWSLQRVHDYASGFVRRGARQVLIDTRLNIFLRNLREARRVGLELPGALGEAAARLPADLERARWNDPRIREAAGWFQTAAAAATTTGGIGVAVGGFLAALGAVVSALPGAIGADPATTGLYIRPYVPGTSPAGQPRWDAGYPAGQVRPRVVSSIGLSPEAAIQAALEPRATFVDLPDPENEKTGGGVALVAAAGALALLLGSSRGR